jgi:hypothetical protein
MAFVTGTVITSTWLNSADDIVNGVWSGATTVNSSAVFNIQQSSINLFSTKTNNDVVLGKSGAATGDTTGHHYIQSVAGTPTGVPTGYSGYNAIRYDSTAHKLWVYDAGWKGVVLA